MTRRAVVVGAGPAGAACALSLADAGWSVVIVERSAAPADGAGIVLHPNAIRALDALGLGGQVRDSGCTLSRLILSGEDYTTAVPLQEVWGGGARTVAISRVALANLMYDAIEARGIDIRRGASVASVSDDAEAPSVTLADGCRLSADLVVGCDGIRSAARASVHGAGAPVATGLWWARWVTPTAVVGRDEWRTQSHGRTVTGAYAIGPAETHLFLQAPAEAAVESAALIDRAVRESSILAAGLKGGARLVHCGPGAVAEEHVWHGRRVVLAGDAAHAMSPTMSEGGGLAIEDGFVLGSVLRDGRRDIGGALSEYAERREARVGWAARMGRLQLRAALSPRTRRGGLGVQAATEYLRSIYLPLTADA